LILKIARLQNALLNVPRMALSKYSCIVLHLEAGAYPKNILGVLNLGVCIEFGRILLVLGFLTVKNSFGG